MKGLICQSPKSLQLFEAAELEVPKEWVPLDVQCVGICGTDFHIYDGNQPYLQYPRVMGHEVSCRVGKDYQGTAFRPGELVVVNPYLNCGTCHACQMGKPNCCERLQVIGVHRDGAMVERIALPASNLVPAEGLTRQQAAMVEFLAIGRHAVARTGLGKGARTLVVGAGPIGLAVALFARLEGADVYLLDVSEEKLSLVHDRFGFAVLNACEIDQNDMLSAFTHVFDATGNIKAMNAGLTYVAHGGTYTLVSVVMDDLVLPDPEFHKREVTLFGSRNALSSDFEYVMEAIRSGKIDTASLNTHHTDLESAVSDLPKWASDRHQVIKALIEIAA